MGSLLAKCPAVICLGFHPRNSSFLACICLSSLWRIIMTHLSYLDSPAGCSLLCYCTNIVVPPIVLAIIKCRPSPHLSLHPSPHPSPSPPDVATSAPLLRVRVRVRVCDQLFWHIVHINHGHRLHSLCQTAHGRCNNYGFRFDDAIVIDTLSRALSLAPLRSSTGPVITPLIAIDLN